jgi:DNA invertase Pin-like site-specific DNA recombinase
MVRDVRRAPRCCYQIPPSFGVGIRTPRARLTEDEVREIRRSYANGGVSMRELGEEYGVTRTNIWRIVRRVSWRHL